MATNRSMGDTGYKKSIAAGHPTTPSSGDPVRLGNATGVAMTTERADGLSSIDFGPGEYLMSVQAVNDSGNSAVAAGDDLYYTDADTPRLSKKASGRYFGWAVEVVTSGATATIRVQHVPSGSNTPASGSVGIAQIDANIVQYVTVSLTAAQVKALRATPIALVAAPGAGNVIRFLGATLLLDYGSEVLAETADNLAVRYLDGSGVIVSQAIETTGFIDQAGDMASTAEPKIDAIATKAQCENRALVLHNTGDGEISGNATNDSVLRVKVRYAIHATGW